MEIMIDLENIKDPGKMEWLLHTLKLMGIGFEAVEKRQTLDEYNEELEAANAEIERGEFVTANDLKIQSQKW